MSAITCRAIRIHETGGPETLRWEEVSVNDPGPGEVRVRNTAVGLNLTMLDHEGSGLYHEGSGLAY